MQAHAQAYLGIIKENSLHNLQLSRNSKGFFLTYETKYEKSLRRYRMQKFQFSGFKDYFKLN